MTRMNSLMRNYTYWSWMEQDIGGGEMVKERRGC